MVNLPKAIAKILHKIITIATFGLQVRVVGTTAKTGNNAIGEPPKQLILQVVPAPGAAIRASQMPRLGLLFHGAMDLRQKLLQEFTISADVNLKLWKEDYSGYPY
jgi:hypothetical protein